MSDRIRPGPEAKARLQALGQKAFQEFFDEVPNAAMQRIARYLPSIDGFRKTSEAGIIKQKEALVRRLNRSAPDDKDYGSLYFIWRTWIDEHLPNAELAQELIDGIEEAAGEIQSGEKRDEVLLSRTDELLSKLKDESKENRCTREQIERLYTFSPLPPTPAAAATIAASKSSHDVDRDEALSGLPSRLRQDERDIETLKADVARLNERIESAITEFGNLKQDATKTRSDSARLSEFAERTAKALEEFTTRSEIKDKEIASRVESRLGELRREIEGVASELKDLSARLPMLSELQGALERIGSVNQKYDSALNRLGGIVAALSQDLEELQAAATQPSPSAALSVDMAVLSSRVDAIERSLSRISEHQIPPNEPKPLIGTPERPPPPNADWQPLASEPAPTTLDFAAAIVSQFNTILQSHGLRKSAVSTFAEECAAAVLARQVVFLRGAFAVQLARSFAQGVGGGSSARLSVPLGLEHGQGIAGAILEATSGCENAGTIGAVAVENVNMSAFEILREALEDAVALRSINQRSRRVAIFATLSKGVASLPIEPELLELGPVFELDYLDWRTSATYGAPLPAGAVSSQLDDDLYAQQSQASVELEEIIKLARLFGKRKSPPFERTAAQAFRALKLFRSDKEPITPLQSLYFGWILPRWKAFGLSKNDVDSELDGGKADAKAADPRLSSLLEAEFPDNDGGSRGR